MGRCFHTDNIRIVLSTSVEYYLYAKRNWRLGQYQRVGGTVISTGIQALFRIRFLLADSVADASGVNVTTDFSSNIVHVSENNAL